MSVTKSSFHRNEWAQNTNTVKKRFLWERTKLMFRQPFFLLQYICVWMCALFGQNHSLIHMRARCVCSKALHTIHMYHTIRGRMFFHTNGWKVSMSHIYKSLDLFINSTGKCSSVCQTLLMKCIHNIHTIYIKFNNVVAQQTFNIWSFPFQFRIVCLRRRKQLKKN